MQRHHHRNNFTRDKPRSLRPTPPVRSLRCCLLTAPLLLLLLLLNGCASPDREPPRVPVPSTRYEWSPGVPKRDKLLLVFLPGRGTTGQDFVRQGFLRALGHSDPDAPDRATGGLGQTPGANLDAVTVDLTYPYYEGRIATKRLHDDIIAPARAAGYRRIWLVGCSMGGLGAIMYDHEYPGEISGIVALAPYLGEKNVVAEIQASGGLARWQPKQPLADDDFQRRLWLAIRAGRYGQPGHLPLVLGYGTHDRFAYGHRLLAANLPSDRVFQTFGFHDWATWRHLWREILASPVSPLAPPAPHSSIGPAH